MDERGRGRVGCIGTVAILLVLAGAMLFTNPSFDAHKEAIYEHAEAEAATGGWWARIRAKAAETAGVLDFLALEYRNYYLASVTIHEKDVLSVGLFGKVFVLDAPGEEENTDR